MRLHYNSHSLQSGMWQRLVALVCLVLFTGVVFGQEVAPPKFTAKPKIRKAAQGKPIIEFAVDRETDVAIFIEDANGKIIRHLVAGVLGTNPPPPLVAGLTQSAEWDGLADYGKPAENGPFKARVSLGMRVRFDKVLLSDPNTMDCIRGLAVGPDGTLYVLNQVGGAVWYGEQIIAFDRNGNYLRTVSPFPSNLPFEKVKGFGAFEVDGRPTALVHSHRLQLFPGSQSPRKTGMAVTPDGKAIMRLAGGNFISTVGTAGDAIWENPSGPPLLPATYPPDKDGKFRGGMTSRPWLTVSSDGKWAYISGFQANSYSAKTANPAVFRVPLPDRTPATPFFGDPLNAGNEKEKLGGAPRGLAVDGKGNLLVADIVNHRIIAITEREGKYVSEFAVDSPDCVAVNAKTGAIYVTRVSVKAEIELIKFAQTDAPKDGQTWEVKEVAKVKMTLDGNPAFLPPMILDTSIEPPLIWSGTDGGTLRRIEDLGETFGEPRIVSNRNAGNNAFLDVSVDRLRKEIYTRCGTGQTWWWRYMEESDTFEKVSIPERSGGGQGVNMLPGPDGNLYGLRWPYFMIKWDRNGKPLAWEEPETPETFLDKALKPTPVPKMQAHHKFVPVSETEMPHCMGIRWSDGHIFVLQPGRPGDRPPKALHEYLPSGKKVTTDPIIWKTSDAVLGPRFDAAGNIYIAEHLGPKGWSYPPEMVELFGEITKRINSDTPQAENASMYGSIIKFSPKGGMVHVPTDGLGYFAGYNPFEGEPKLDPSLNSMEVDSYHSGRHHPIKISGAQWIHPGVSHVGVYGCTCENVTFDVDEFGRVFAPDLNMFRVRVIDPNGNALLTFGGYGNSDSCGPNSREKGLDKPDIAFAWLVGVGVTDRYVYTGDSINRRMLRSRIEYATEESADIK